MPPPSNRTGFRPVQRKALVPSIISSPALGRNVTVPYCRRSAEVTQECGAGFSGGGGPEVVGHGHFYRVLMGS
jgi:hypothetical protein